MARPYKGQRRQRRSSRQESSCIMPKVPRIAVGNNMCYGFPTQLLTKLRYTSTYSLTSTTGSLAKQVMYLNSTFDPDNTGVGHQPLYRDTYAGIYNHYAVVSTKTRCIFQSLFSGTACNSGIVLEDDNNTSSSGNVLIEQNRGLSHLLPPLLGSISNHTFVHNWDCKRDLGIDPFTSEEYKTPVGQNPTEVASLILYNFPADGSSTGTVQVQVLMEFLVLFTELQTPNES